MSTVSWRGLAVLGGVLLAPFGTMYLLPMALIYPWFWALPALRAWISICVTGMKSSPNERLFYFMALVVGTPLVIKLFVPVVTALALMATLVYPFVATIMTLVAYQSGAPRQNPISWFRQTFAMPYLNVWNFAATILDWSALLVGSPPPSPPPQPQ